jgi:hypothetical protein
MQRKQCYIQIARIFMDDGNHQTSTKTLNRPEVNQTTNTQHISNANLTVQQWTLRKQGKLRKTEAGMKFFRKTAKHAIFDHKINQNILKRTLKNKTFFVEVNNCNNK